MPLDKLLRYAKHTQCLIFKPLSVSFAHPLEACRIVLPKIWNKHKQVSHGFIE